jgi:hypothetical protein
MENSRLTPCFASLNNLCAFPRIDQEVTTVSNSVSFPRLSTEALLIIALLATPAFADEPFVATLCLDAFSVVSFGDQDVFPIPEGSEIEFEFAATEATGSVAFVIRPRKADIATMPLGRENESMRFTLGRNATGVMRREPDGGVVMEIDAFVIVTVDHPETPGSKRIPMRFTTESAQAKSLNGDRTIDVSGGRVSGRGVQLVGTATNDEDDYPRPGAPVYVILSGAFDRLPVLR